MYQWATRRLLGRFMSSARLGIARAGPGMGGPRREGEGGGRDDAMWERAGCRVPHECQAVPLSEQYVESSALTS